MRTKRKKENEEEMAMENVKGIIRHRGERGEGK